MERSSQPKQGGEEGEPIDEKLQNGPFAERSCTDPLCCLIFLAFIGGMIGIAGYAITKGNPGLIGRGYDADGKMCGVDIGYEDYPYLYFPMPHPDHLTRTVCLKTCPTSVNDLVQCHLNSAYRTNCLSTQTSINAMAVEMALGVNLASKFYVYPTSAYVKRFCLPQTSGDTFSAVSDTLFSSDVLEQWVSDIRETWPVIAGSIGAAFIIGFIYMILLRYCSGVLTWLAILGFIAGMGVLGWRFYQDAKRIEETLVGTGGQDSHESSAQQTVTTEKVIAYVCWGIAGFTFLAVLCLYSRIRLAIAIMKAAADYIKDTPLIMLVPPVTVVILICFFTYWGGTAIFLVSAGDATQIKNTPFGSFTFDKTLKRLLIYHLFGLLWLNAFIIAATQFVIASSTALWYFSQGTGQSTPGTISTSIGRLFRYHFGSIAFGALILAIVQFIRLVLAYMEIQAKKMAGKDGKLVRYALKCLQCYLACFERFIKFLNKNAYIQIALTGKSFCGAARAAFSLILKNPLRMGVVASIGGIFVLFGKIFVAGITALGAFYTITSLDTFSTQIYSPFIPTIVIFIFAYVIGAVFMTIYGLAADTILACFIVDEDINSKKNAPARHCPQSLRSFLNENSKKK